MRLHRMTGTGQSRSRGKEVYGYDTRVSINSAANKTGPASEQRRRIRKSGPVTEGLAAETRLPSMRTQGSGRYGYFLAVAQSKPWQGNGPPCISGTGSLCFRACASGPEQHIIGAIIRMRRGRRERRKVGFGNAHARYWPPSPGPLFDRTTLRLRWSMSLFECKAKLT